MEKKQYESKRPDQKDLEVDGSGTVTGSANIGGSGGSRRDTSINTGGGAYVGGDVSIGGGDFVGRDMCEFAEHSVDEIERWFEDIYSAIDAKPNFDEFDKIDLKNELKEIQEEVSKGDFADETFLSRRLRNIQRIDPEILDVVLATLTNPAAGFSAVVRKAAESMKTSAA